MNDRSYPRHGVDARYAELALLHHDWRAIEASRADAHALSEGPRPPATPPGAALTF